MRKVFYAILGCFLIIDTSESGIEIKFNNYEGIAGGGLWQAW
jgi:hypothetical protein